MYICKNNISEKYDATVVSNKRKKLNNLNLQIEHV